MYHGAFQSKWTHRPKISIVSLTLHVNNAKISRNKQTPSGLDSWSVYLCRATTNDKAFVCSVPSFVYAVIMSYRPCLWATPFWYQAALATPHSLLACYLIIWYSHETTRSKQSPAHKLPDQVLNMESYPHGHSIMIKSAISNTRFYGMGYCRTHPLGT